MWIFWGMNVFIGGVVLSNFIGSQQTYTTVEEDLQEFELEGEKLGINIDKPNFHQMIQVGDLTMDDKTLMVDDVTVVVTNSEDNKVRIWKETSGRGRSFKDAKDNIKSALHNIQIDGSTITIPSYFSIAAGDKYRGQDITYVIEKPAGIELDLNGAAKRYIRVRENYRKG